MATKRKPRAAKSNKAANVKQAHAPCVACQDWEMKYATIVDRLEAREDEIDELRTDLAGLASLLVGKEIERKSYKELARQKAREVAHVEKINQTIDKFAAWLAA